MSPAKLARNLERMHAIANAAAELENCGVCWAGWARDRGLQLQSVRNVLKGRGPCLRGESRRAADLMMHEALRADPLQPDDPNPGIECRVCGTPSPEALNLLADMAARLAMLQSGLDRLLADARQEETS